VNIWQRGSGFTFQKRIPSDLVGALGASPIRLVLPPCGKRKAERAAAVLNGVAEARFQRLRVGIDKMDGIRDKVLEELRGVLETRYLYTSFAEEQGSDRKSLASLIRDASQRCQLGTGRS